MAGIRHIKREKQGLRRSLSLFEATVYGLGVIFGAGIYALIGEAAGIAGNSIWLSFILAAIVASFTALSYCELSSMFPKCAAEYIYVKNAFRSSFFGFMVGWISLFATMISVSAVSLGFAGYFSGLFGTPIMLTAISLIIILSIVNFIGLKESAWLNIVFTVVAVLGLVLIIIFSLPFIGSIDYLASTEAMPFPEMLNNVAIAASLIFFAYIGFEDIANISEETKEAKSTVPKAILLALAISTILYVLVSISVVSVVPWQLLSKSAAPISLVASTILGVGAAPIFSFIALFATASTVLILLIGLSRLFYGMSRDHSLPKILSSVHSKTKTPFVAIALTSVIAMLLVLSGELKFVAFITNFGIFMLFFMVNLAVIILRFTKPGHERVFRIPLSIGKLPLLPFFGVIATAFMISKIGLDSVLFGTVAIMLGIPAYLLLARPKNAPCKPKKPQKMAKKPKKRL